MLKRANSKQTRICAFCRFWYDPTNSAIKPWAGDFFDYDDNVKKPCSKNANLEKPSWSGCGEFECKF